MTPNIHLLRRTLLFSLCLCATLFAPSLKAQTLFSDDFSGTSLSPSWTVQRGYATLVDGWARLQGSNGGTRDSFIMTGVGGSWADCVIRTKFHADGGGNSWYNSLINIRVQSQFGWGFGTFYGLYIYPQIGRAHV